MLSPQDLPPVPPEFHPEFGYIWPAVHTRRMVRIGLMSAAFGVLCGAIAVLATTPRTDSDAERTATVLAAVSPDEPAAVGAATSVAPVASVEMATPPVVAAKGCNDQTWPYLESGCLNSAARKRQPARVLKPEAPAQSAPAQVVPASGPEITAAAKIDAPSKAAKKREKTAKTRRQGRDREVADRERGPYADPRSAYASPYASRYDTPRRGWGW
jgi:hypothetical protein